MVPVVLATLSSATQQLEHRRCEVRLGSFHPVRHANRHTDRVVASNTRGTVTVPSALQLLRHLPGGLRQVHGLDGAEVARLVVGGEDEPVGEDGQRGGGAGAGGKAGGRAGNAPDQQPTPPPRDSFVIILRG